MSTKWHMSIEQEFIYSLPHFCYMFLYIL
jgi:hypothetical protein